MKTAFLLFLSPLLLLPSLAARNTSFHNAPTSAKATKNPYSAKPKAIAAGKQVYGQTCVKCHGSAGEGIGETPPLASGPAQQASDGEIFWYITRGDAANGMPSWAALSKQERWQVVAYVKSLGGSHAASAKPATPAVASTSASSTPPPKPPFTDYRFEKPGAVHHITVQDLPAPFASGSATAPPRIVARPENAWPVAPPDFKVDLFTTGLTNPRLMRRAPNGDIFLAETSAGNIKVLRGIRKDGKAGQIQLFASGLNIPFGIAFYPPGDNPQ